MGKVLVKQEKIEEMTPGLKNANNIKNSKDFSKEEGKEKTQKLRVDHLKALQYIDDRIPRILEIKKRIKEKIKQVRDDR